MKNIGTYRQMPTRPAIDDPAYFPCPKPTRREWLGQMSSDRKKHSRFVVFQEPLGRWCVWDEAKREPAELAGHTLTGLTEIKAAAACRVLANIYRSVREAHVTTTHEQEPPRQA
jgi:hypothetical protein